MRKATLLRSVSAIATAAASAGGAHQALAQDNGTDGYYYNVQGGLMFSPAESYLADIEDKMGSAPTGIVSGSSFSGSAYFYDSGADFDDLFGVTGSVSLGKQLDPNWDVRGTASITRFGETSAWYGYYGGVSGIEQSGGSATASSFYHSWYSGYQAATYSFGWEALDLEIGYSPVLSGDMNVRLFAGIRGLHFEENSSYSGYSGYGVNTYQYSGALYSGFSAASNTWYSGMSKTEFFGIGPRVGAQVSKRFEGTNFGLSASVAGSVLFGQQKTKWDGWWEGYASFSGYGGSGGSGVANGSPVGGSTYSTYSGSSFSGSSYSSSMTVSKAVLDIQGQIGLDYYLDDANKLTVGVQAEKLFNVGPYDDNDVTRQSAGVFVGLTGSF